MSDLCAVNPPIVGINLGKLKQFNLAYTCGLLKDVARLSSKRGS